MEEKTRSELLQRNDQVRAVSTLAGNGGLALFAAGLGRWFFEKFDENVMLWLVAGAAIMWVGVKLLILLEAEI